jgi:aspartyl protease family protein
MFNRFAVFVVATAFAVGWLAPGSKPRPGLVAAAVQPESRTGVERDSAIGLKEMVVQRQPNGHFYVDGTVNGQPVRFLVDTGATTVALTTEDASRAGLSFSPSEFEPIGYGASGPVTGKRVVLDRVALGRNEVSQVRAVIMADTAGLNISLLGQSYLERIGSVQISGDEMVLR